MLNAFNRFEDSFARIVNIETVYKHLNGQLMLPNSEVGDILRTQIVYAVSALDKLIHDLVKIGMIEIFLGMRPVTDAYLKFQINMEQSDLIKNATFPPPESLFGDFISAAQGHLAYQHPDKIGIALNLISSEPHKWSKIATCMTIPEIDVKTILKNVVIRRNQIVHESDLDLSTGLIQQISESDAKTSVDFIKQLGGCIYSLVK